ncbi:MAG TPA: serine protease [Rhizomicrobium sp.]
MKSRSGTARSLSLALAATGLVFGGLQPAFGQVFQSDRFIEAIRTMKRSVTPVICLRAAGPTSVQPLIVGSGFFISERGDFITATHVVAAFLPADKAANACPMAIWFRGDSDAKGNWAARFFSVAPSDCVIDTSLDIARCRTTEDLTKADQGKFEPLPAVVDSSRQDDGTAIAVMGFPLLSSAPISSRGYIGGYQDSSQGPVQMVLDRAAWPGNSGGPVYDSRGKIVGMVVQAGEGLASGISFARTGYALSLFMTAHPLEANK